MIPGDLLWVLMGAGKPWERRRGLDGATFGNSGIAPVRSDTRRPGRPANVDNHGRRIGRTSGLARESARLSGLAEHARLEVDWAGRGLALIKCLEAERLTYLQDREAPAAND